MYFYIRCPPTDKAYTKARGADLVTVQYPKGNSEQGTSSATVAAQSAFSQCTVHGFPLQPMPWTPGTDRQRWAAYRSYHLYGVPPPGLGKYRLIRDHRRYTSVTTSRDSSYWQSREWTNHRRHGSERSRALSSVHSCHACPRVEQVAATTACSTRRVTADLKDYLLRTLDLKNYTK